MKNFRFEDLPAALESVLEKITIIQEELENIKKYFQPKEPVELMTRHEVADYLKIDISTVYNWTKKGTIISYGIGYRVYYKRSEIESSLIRIN
ncbi:helix-turn-helix domain-containing protein [Arenibacter algicola]|uniref:helix-turn-helix domain-containing protein n=1 Tax=Arenibacter algicola TaxID=616991 RepID=UPI001C0673C8|nr:helix-turn-helix domain-containing protein [Arenibacter algicola]MBU2905112.1 helix-turn-helix domain-containing protein [Arenibacter algicola]